MPTRISRQAFLTTAGSGIGALSLSLVSGQAHADTTACPATPSEQQRKAAMRRIHHLFNDVIKFNPSTRRYEVDPLAFDAYLPGSDISSAEELAIILNEEMEAGEDRMTPAAVAGMVAAIVGSLWGGCQLAREAGKNAAYNGLTWNVYKTHIQTKVRLAIATTLGSAIVLYGALSCWENGLREAQ
ncbi:hypothetical protein [Actinomyces faecalis]|uniref:hypothetical protein n=1 Tax=Actinomyces faecalis TaxID=2722820 RepID=UPI001556FA84|nr:hypothetical protein [Actinomyces faecalis]